MGWTKEQTSQKIEQQQSLFIDLSDTEQEIFTIIKQNKVVDAVDLRPRQHPHRRTRRSDRDIGRNDPGEDAGAEVGRWDLLE